MRKFKVGMDVIKDDGYLTQIEDIYFSGEFESEIIQCTDGNSYINDNYCEIKPFKFMNSRERCSHCGSIKRDEGQRFCSRDCQIVYNRQ